VSDPGGTLWRRTGECQGEGGRWLCLSLLGREVMCRTSMLGAMRRQPWIGGDRAKSGGVETSGGSGVISM
jgi:hypothetical protein